MILLSFFKIYFGVPRCTVKKVFVVTSSVRGEVCGRHQKHAPLSVVRLIVEFLFLSIPPLHHTRAVTSGDPDLSSLFDFLGRS